MSATWTVRVDGVSSPSWTFEDGRHQLDLHRILNVSLDAVRGRAAWRTLPALIPNPWTAHSHIVISLPDSGGGVDLSGGEAAVLNLIESHSQFGWVAGATE